MSRELQALVAVRITRDLERAEITSALGSIGFRRVLEELYRSGLVRERTAGRLELSESGCARLSELLLAERKALKRDDLAAHYDEFLHLDAELKSAVTSYQLAHGTVGPLAMGEQERNSEAAFRTALEDLHRRALSLLGRISADRPRFSNYGRRLERALAEIRGGKLEFVAGVSVDSYHTIWFELHEDLLMTMGEERAR